MTNNHHASAGPAPSRLAADLERAREEERIRLARAVHDELGQALTGLKMDLSWLKRRLPDACHADRLAAILQKTDAMLALTDTAIAAVRRIATELRPVVLDELGLAPAVEWQAQQFQERTDIRCRVSLGAVDLRGEPATALFRILQEALTNVFRHAQATEVQVALREEAGVVVLEVIDNGKGISDPVPGNGRSLGVVGMRERAAIQGGWLQVGRFPGGGTRVVARLPRGGPAERLREEQR